MLRERLPRRSLPSFFDSGKTTSYNAGEVLYQEDYGIEDSLIYGVREGLVLLERRDPEIKEPSLDETYVLFVARPGDVFGVEDVVEGYHTSSAKTVVPSSIVSLSFPQTSENISWFYRTIVGRIEDAEEKNSLLGIRNGKKDQKVAYAALELAENEIIHVMHRTIGNVVGTTREEVSRRMMRLGEKGIIYQSGEKRIIVNDPAQLLDETHLYKRPSLQRRPVIVSPQFLQEPTDIRHLDQPYSAQRSRTPHRGRRKLSS